jgi:hypothetical protein
VHLTASDNDILIKLVTVLLSVGVTADHHTCIPCYCHARLPSVGCWSNSDVLELVAIASRLELDTLTPCNMRPIHTRKQLQVYEAMFMTVL